MEETIIKIAMLSLYNRKQTKTILISLYIILIAPSTFSQPAQTPQKIYFLSDIQTAMTAEKVLWKEYRNWEARDSLFADIIRQYPTNFFLTGDLTSMGAKEKAWTPLDVLLNSLNKTNTSVFAVPGNHEYLYRPSRGMHKFKQRFKEEWIYGYAVNIDSVAIVMLNSNFKHLSRNERSKQIIWYKSAMDSLDADPAVKAVIVCTHHAPYSNSKVVGSSEKTAEAFVPAFEKSTKAKLFISGHSHNLEYFASSSGKHFLVIGGGGGIAQPLIPVNKREHTDLLSQEAKPLYFYLIIERNGNSLKLKVRGFKRDFTIFEWLIDDLKTD